MTNKKKIGCTSIILWSFIVLVALGIYVGVPSEEEKKSEIDSLYSIAKSLPAESVCENKDAYEKVLSLERIYGTDYYKEISEQKYDEYSIKCEQKRIEDIRNKYSDFEFIYGDSRRVKKDFLRSYMIKVLEITEDCIPEYVDKSTNKKRSYFLLCENADKIYWTEEDMKQGVVRTVIPHLSNTEAILLCQELIKSRLNNPETFSPNVFNTDTQKVGDSRTFVTMTFSAKNGLGMKVDYRASCLVGNEVYEVQELVQI